MDVVCQYMASWNDILSSFCALDFFLHPIRVHPICYLWIKDKWYCLRQSMVHVHIVVLRRWGFAVVW